MFFGFSFLTTGIAQLTGARVSQRIGLLFVGFALVLAIQCNVIHDLFFYGNFNGEAVNFRSNGKSFDYEWYGFLSGLLIVTVLLQWKRPQGRWLAALPILSSSLLLIPILLSGAGKQALRATPELVEPSVFEFSRNGNLIHLLPDGFQSDIVHQVLEEHPELAAEFEGFTHFSNHLGMFQGTAPSVPTILTGEPFDLSQGHNYQQVIPHVQSNGYPTRLQEAGYRMDYALISSAYCVSEADSCVVRPFNDMKSRGYFRHQTEDLKFSARILGDLTLFRLMPMRVKEKIYDNGHWTFSDTTMDGSSPWPDPVLREWAENMNVTDGPPVFKFYHYIGTHIPPHWDADCNYQRSLERSRENYQAQTYCVLKGIAKLIAALKDQGIYDDTAIVISGDHGCAIAPIDNFESAQVSSIQPALMGSARPALMIKERHNRNPLTFSRAPSSLQDIAPTALALAGIETQSGGVNVFDLAEDENRSRNFWPYSIRDLFTKPVPHMTYTVGSDVRDSATWLVDGISPFRTAPSLYDPVNYRNGKDLIHGVRFSTTEPDKEATWVNGKQLAFLISQPQTGNQADTEGLYSDYENELHLGLHIPKWMPEQEISVSINGEETIRDFKIEKDKGFWTRIRLPLADTALLAENNFVSVRFAHSGFPPGIDHFEVAALVQSIRLAKKPPSDTSTTAASPP
jgi:hypothetical protein